MPKYSRAKTWLLRAFLILLGLVLSATSLVGLLEGIISVPWFNQKLGERGTMPLGLLLLFGLLLIGIGIRVDDHPAEARRKRH